ncbi:hypothetical protein BK659_13785 [Pseudomonas brassicacearum]|uniref:Uncharacterized protein n=1 Tax=Pseudomonas brassicacearum TaxID=930166 RepID=A0A423H5H3_9PSED|nr:hypothetical protein [Pseudomonas brassicacearum]RON08464.1 hypothetical protein BK659_13785 [Pseudomonas brassicacearum]
MNIKFKHEKSVENLFKDSFEQAARNKDYIYTSASLDSQDRLVGADYLFTDHTQYAIIEFKYREGDLPSEVKKKKRLELCNALYQQKNIRPLHDKCHFAAWSDASNKITIETNIYFNEVCNESFWGDAFKHVAFPDKTTRKEQNDFIDSFIDGEEGGSFADFNQYMKWLLNLGDQTNTNGYLELLISNPLDRRATGLAFTSIENMQKWVVNNKKTPSMNNSKNNKRGGPSGSGGKFS